MANRGQEGWDAAHERQFGGARWEGLKEALRRDPGYLLVLNPFLPAEALEGIRKAYRLLETSIPGAYSFEISDDPECKFLTKEDNGEGAVFVDPRKERGGEPWTWQMAPFTLVQGAEAFAAAALGAREGENVLEVCAAPGGRAVVLAGALFAGTVSPGSAVRAPVRPGGRLVCNEASKQKAARLQRAMADVCPPELLDGTQTKIPSVAFAAVEPGTSHNTVERLGPYDRILLAAPCFEDGAYLRRGQGLERWSAGALKVAADKQLKLLYNALWLLKEGGLLLYCVGALSHEECDGVIERLLGKCRGTFEVEVLPLEEHISCMVPSLGAEATAWGARVLPDRTPFAPLYLSRLRLVGRTAAAP